MIRAAMLHANVMALGFIKPSSLPIEVLYCGVPILDHVCSFDLDLELYSYSLEIHQICKHAFESYRLLDRQTDRHDRYCIPRHLDRRRGSRDLTDILTL